MKKWISRRSTASAHVADRKSLPRRSRGLLVALFALIAVTALAVSTISVVTLAKKRARKSAAGSVTSAKVASRTSSGRARRGAASRKETAKHNEIIEAAGESAAERYEQLLEMEEYWATRLTYPTGN